MNLSMCLTLASYTDTFIVSQEVNSQREAAMIGIDALEMFAGANATTTEDGATIASPSGDIWTRCAVAFKYTDKDGNVTRRVVEPTTVWETKAGDLVLTGFCHDRREVRTFHIWNMEEKCTGGLGLRMLKAK